MSDSRPAIRLVAACAARSHVARRASSSTLPQIAQKQSATMKMIATSRLTGRFGVNATRTCSDIVFDPYPGANMNKGRGAAVNPKGTRARLVNEALKCDLMG